MVPAACLRSASAAPRVLSCRLAGLSCEDFISGVAVMGEGGSEHERLRMAFRGAHVCARTAHDTPCACARRWHCAAPVMTCAPC